MNSLLETINWMLHDFNKFMKYLFSHTLLNLVWLALMFVVCTVPIFLFWDSEESEVLWVTIVFFVSVFGTIFYKVYREQEEPEVIEAADGITFINDPKLPSQRERIIIALRHARYWFIFGIVIIAYTFFLIIRNEENMNSDVSNNITNQIIAENASTTETAPTFTEDEIYRNPYITHIRTALNGYIDGSNNGVEGDMAITGGEFNCGLKDYDTEYYKSKFIVFSVEPSKYGGMDAYIIFKDRPDSIFWAYVYKYEDSETYTLRAFCASGPKEEDKEKFPEMIKAMLEAGEFPYSL